MIWGIFQDYQKIQNTILCYETCYRHDCNQFIKLQPLGNVTNFIVIWRKMYLLNYSLANGFPLVCTEKKLSGWNF